MKKLFFIAAIASAAFVSCTKNELAPSVTEQEEITFATPVSNVVTKATLVNTTYPTTSGFSVFADYHKDEYNTAKDNPTKNFTPYMRGTEGVAVTHKTKSITIGSNTYNSYWSPANSYYWPKDGYLTFAAYSPTAANAHTEITYSVTNGIQMNDFTIQAPAAQYDLMLSNRATDQTSEKMVINTPDPYDGVQIVFTHALSAIDFTVKTAKNYATDNYTIDLKSITITNAYSKGDLTQFANIDQGTAGNNWTDYKEEASYLVPNSAITSLTNSAQEITPDTNTADLILLPQALTHSPNKVSVVVVYTVSHPDMGTGKSIEYTTTLPLDNGTISTWDAGKRYTYNITIGMEEVIFAPTVTVWVPVPGIDL